MFHALSHQARNRIFQMESWQRTLAVLFIAQVCTAVGFSIIFPFLPLYVEDLGTNTGLSIEFWAGMVFSAHGFTMMIASPIWGSLADRFGRKLMVQRALFGGAVIICMMAFARTAEDLVLIRAVQGLVTGSVSASNAMVAASAPRHKSGFAMATIQVALWAGIALGPLIGGPLADAYGYRIPFFVTTAMLLISGLLVHFLAEEHIDREAQSAKRKQGMAGGLRHVLSMEGVPQIYVVRFMTGLSRSMIVPIMPLFVASLLVGGALRIEPPAMFDGLSPTAARVATYTGFAIGVASATSTLSALYLGRLGDRIGHRRILLGSALAAMFAYLPQAYVTSPWQLIALQALAGLAYGGIVAAPSALLAQYTDPGEEGTVYGLDNSVFAGARAVAPLVGAGVAYWLGLRTTFQVLAGLFLFMAFVAMVLLPKQPRMTEAMAPDGDNLQPSAAD